jgi:single-stranded-DNA-specific exonuclease
LFLAQLRGDKICIYSDYDTDAVTATATMYHGIIDLGFDANNVEFYAPDRFTEGYGMNAEAIDMLSKKFDLIISVDCGINSWPEADVVLKNNSESKHKCDLIITDHHHLTDQIPDCIAVINCRMGEVYSQRPNELKKINQEILNQIKEIVEKSNNKDFGSDTIPLVRGGTAGDGVLISDATQKNNTTKALQNLQSWLTVTQIQPSQYLTNPNKFLSQSVTGVGVVWFSLVWYAYFLEYLDV